jgi:hypothetical protein
MNPKHFPTSAPNRARCPVCHQAVYSRAGIHPQCAMRQAEPPRPKVGAPRAAGGAPPAAVAAEAPAVGALAATATDAGGGPDAAS